MNLFDLLTKKNIPEMTPIQLNNDGAIDNAASLALRNQTTPLTLGERLTGRTMTQDTQTIDPQTGAAKLETLVNYRPGLFNDIAGGYNENRFTPASLNNFGQNTLEGGRNKGFAYRLGEGLGSLARFGESPLGRSLLVGGAIGALGGSPVETLTFGAVTGATNQMNRVNDRIYRDDLIHSQQQALQNNPEFANLPVEEQKAQLNAVADNINNLRGYMNQNTYGNLIKSQQIRDNADWRKMYFDTQQANLKAQRNYQRQQDAVNNQFRRDQLNQQAADRAANMAFNYYNANLGHQDRMAALAAKNQQNNGEDFGDIEQQLNNFQSTFKNMPSKAESYTLGALRNATGTQTEKEANFNAQRTLLFNQIARKLGGEKGVLSDNDIKRIEAALPTLTDSLAQKNAKMQAVYDLLDIKRGQSPRSQSFTSGKYKVTVKG